MKVCGEFCIDYKELIQDKTGLQVSLSKFLIDREKTTPILEFGKRGSHQLTLSILGSESKHVLGLLLRKTTTHLVH